jgi:hypothetical protein
MHLSRDEGKGRGRMPSASPRFYCLKSNEHPMRVHGRLIGRSSGPNGARESLPKARRSVPGEVLGLETPAGSPAAQQKA